MKAIYTITLKELKNSCLIAVKKVSFFKKKKIIFSLTFPFIILLFPLLPFLSDTWIHAFFAILIVMIYIYFYGYGARMYIAVKNTRYKHSPKIIPMSVEIEEDSLVLEQEFIKQRILKDSLFTSMETDTNYVLFPAENKYALILIKKSPDNFSDKETRAFNRQIRSLLK